MPTQRSVSEARQLKMPSGRALGYAEYGDPDGFAVLFFHGTPGSRLDAAPMAKAATAAGVRIVAVDRPGMGLSDQYPNRTIPDWPDDVVALADHLGIESFSVLGYSSGAPYALAVAAAPATSGRLHACAVVSGNSPIDDPAVARTLPVDSKVFNFAAQRFPRTAAAFTDAMLRVARRPASWWPRRIGKVFALQYADSDRDVLAAMAQDMPPEAAMDGFVEAVRNGGAGVARDMILEIGDWGFRLEDVEVTVHLWYGSADPMVPLVQGEVLAKRLPRADLHTIEGGGHLIVFDRAGDILGTLAPASP